MTLMLHAIIMSMRAHMTVVHIPAKNEKNRQVFAAPVFVFEKTAKKISRGVVKVLKMSIIISVSS